MRNVLLVLAPSFITCLIFIAIIFYEIIKKSKYHILRIVAFFCMIIYMIITDVPFYKDIIEQETQTVTAEYVKFQSSNTYPGTRKVFFDSKSGQISMFVPSFTRDVAKLKAGETYEVEYFCNSYVIKSYKLVE